MRTLTVHARKADFNVHDINTQNGSVWASAALEQQKLIAEKKKIANTIGCRFH